MWSVAISADGEYIAAGLRTSWGGKAFLFDKDNSTPLWSYATSHVSSIGISADGEYIAVGSGNGKVYLFDKDNGTPLWSYRTAGNFVWTVAISTDGKYIVVGSGNDMIHLFHKDNSTPLWQYDTGNELRSVAISANGEYIASGSVSRSVDLLYNNIPPTASIDSIVPSPADEFDEVNFSGSGSDSSNNITNYQWKSSIDGNLSTEEDFSTTGLSPGNHSISFRVQDNDGVWSPWATTTVYVNARPVLTNGSVTPASGGVSTTFTFSVDYLDPDGTQNHTVQVTLAGLGTFAMADPDGDGTFHYNTTLLWGYRNFSFSATDDYSARATGDTAPHELRVNAHPSATIDASALTNTTFGEDVTLSGSASDPDGSIAAWEWRSDRDGLLGTTTTLTLNNLSVGAHTITFRVRDDSGAWSAPATATLTVQARATQDDAAGPLGLAPLAWAALGGMVLLAGGGAGAYFWRRQAPPSAAGAVPPPTAPGTGGAPPTSVAAVAAPAAPLVAIACPGCQAQMAVPKLGRLQSVRCGSCGLAGEIEI